MYLTFADYCISFNIIIKKKKKKTKIFLKQIKHLFTYLWPNEQGKDASRVIQSLPAETI